jgi:hypothetical protein
VQTQQFVCIKLKACGSWTVGREQEGREEGAGDWDVMAGEKGGEKGGEKRGGDCGEDCCGD